MHAHTRRLTATLSLIALVAAFALSGCGATPKTATAADAPGEWSGSYLQRVYKADFQAAFNAAQEYLVSQGVSVGATRNDPKNGLVVGSNASIKYIFRIKSYPNGLTGVELKVHPTDRARTVKELDGYQKLLPNPTIG